MAYDSEEAASLVARLNAELRDAEPQAIIRAAIEHFGEDVMRDHRNPSLLRRVGAPRA